MKKKIWLATIFLLAAIIVAAILCVTVQAAGTDWWLMFHHDLNHTGTSTSTGPIRNSTLWTYTTGNWVYSSPAVVDGFVYVGSLDKKVYCFNASTGALVWSYTTYAAVYSSPAVVDGRVYVGSGDAGSYGWVYCLNATTGTLVWIFQTYSVDARLGGVYSSPAVVDGRVYVGCDNGWVYCLNATSGAGLWIIGQISGGYIISSPTVVGGLVCVGATDGWIYCRNATNGNPVWSYQTGGAVYSSPAVVGGKLYVGSVDDKVYCLNATTGAHIWNFTTGSDVDSSPALVDDLVYVGSHDGKIYSLNATTGAFVWNYTTGDIIWASSPAIAGGLVYIGSNDTKLYCLNATTGSSVWSYKTDGGVLSSPAVVGGVVYVGSNDGHVYAVSPYVTVSVSPSPVIMDVTQSQLFTPSITHGTPPYSYQWYLNDAPITGETSSTWEFTPSSSGSYTVYVNVTDSDGAHSPSNIATITVNPTPSVSISPTSAPIDVGQSKQFISSVSGGTPPRSYQWYLNDTPVSGAISATWTFTPTSPDSYSIHLKVTDAVTLVATSNIATATVVAAPTASILPNSATLNVGQSQQFNSTVSNGTSPYTYQWCLNGSPVSGATSNTWTFTATSSGSYTVYLNVTDSVGVIATSPTSNVTFNLVIPEFQPSSFLPTFMMASLLAAFFLKRKRSIRTKPRNRLCENQV